MRSDICSLIGRLRKDYFKHLARHLIRFARLDKKRLNDRRSNQEKKKVVKMMKILSLDAFNGPNFDELATIGLVANVPQFCNYTNLQDELQPCNMYLREYPEILVTHDMLATRESARTIGAGDLFLPIQDSVFKKIVSVWREKGFAEAVRLAASENPEHVTKIVHWIATRLKSAFDLIERGIYQREVLPLSGSGSVADVVTTRDWGTSLVRCLCWHPHCSRLAIATRDDRIRIFSQGIPGVPVLRHSAQKSVCCLSWRPYTGRELAAACHTGVLVWTIELGAASNSLSHAILLKHRNHSPVTSVTWHPQGDLLVSCSPTDWNMIVWDVSKEEGVPLKRVGGGGLCFTRWSPCGSRLFAATCRKVFRVWNTGIPTPWSADRWTVPNGRVAAACFGPNLTLLFASTEEPATVFSLPLQENIFDVNKTKLLNDTKIAVPLIDLTKVSFSSNDDAFVTVGGRIVSMEWDSSGKYLAILFQDSPLIALIRTKVSSLSRIVEAKPACLINGFPGEMPNCMQFYQRSDATNSIVCLTIAWSSGRVQHFPIIDDETAAAATVHTMSFSNRYPISNDLYSFNITNYS